MDAANRGDEHGHRGHGAPVGSLAESYMSGLHYSMPYGAVFAAVAGFYFVTEGNKYLLEVQTLTRLGNRADFHDKTESLLAVENAALRKASSDFEYGAMSFAVAAGMLLVRGAVARWLRKQKNH